MCVCVQMAVCGKGSAAGDQSIPVKDILQNRTHFPSFEQLPHENDIDTTYYKLNKRTSVWEPRLTWCFVADITNADRAQTPGFFGRNRTIVKDRDGNDGIPIYFYHDGFSYMDFSLIKKGHTIAVLQAEVHYFMDGQIGLRIENLENVAVIKCSLDQLFSLASHFFKSRDLDVCWKCAKHSDTLRKCSSCKVAKYCDRDCQAADWRERHKTWCKAMPEFIKLVNVRYDRYKSEESCFPKLPFPGRF